MSSRVSGMRVNFLWSLTDFSQRFYNFFKFIPHALKNIRSLGQSIHKIRVFAVETMMLHLKKILGFYLIRSFARGIG
jgi:hypothetical protein